jgi:hypothetical protein
MTAVEHSNAPVANCRHQRSNKRPFYKGPNSPHQRGSATDPRLKEPYWAECERCAIAKEPWPTYAEFTKPQRKDQRHGRPTKH